MAATSASKQQQRTIEQCYQEKQQQQTTLGRSAAAAAAVAVAGETVSDALAAAATAAPMETDPAAPAAAALTVTEADEAAAPATALAVAGAAASAAMLKPFPPPGAMPGSTVSQTYLTNQLKEMGQTHEPFRRSVIEAAASKAIILSADFQHYPTKMVHVNGGWAAVAIFNLMDVKTGKGWICCFKGYAPYRLEPRPRKKHKNCR